ncbi:MAG TPA: hypothetical protein VM347_11455 [Nonomuraea sp.]|nr:hypothetical protein [Nonomuraea sp.]
MADQSWRDRSKAMGGHVVEQAARRIGEHAATHGLGYTNVVFHGGERTPPARCAPGSRRPR